MKALICVHCSDILAPYPEPAAGWRWCRCEHAAVRWRDPSVGLLDVTALHGPRYVRVLGLNNAFLADAVHGAAWGDEYGQHEEWRLLHDQHAETVPPHYLFHEDKRACWAVVIRPNETGDVAFVDYAEVMIERSSLGTPDAQTMRARTSDEVAHGIVERSTQVGPAPGSSGDRAAVS